MSEPVLDTDTDTEQAQCYPLECYGCGWTGDTRVFGMGNKRQCPICQSRSVHSPQKGQNVNRAEYLTESSRLRELGGNPMDAHRAYYAQFVNDRTKAVVLQRFTLERLIGSTDPHMNDLPLQEWEQITLGMQFREWDNLGHRRPPGYRRHDDPPPDRSYKLPLNDLFKEFGTWCSPSDLTCIAKEAARQIVEEHEKDIHSA